MTAYRWFKLGALPVRAEQLKTGTILVYPEKKESDKTAIYARVSSRDQKNDLDRQVARLVKFANDNDLRVSQTITEIGSGLNGHRKKLINLLKDHSVSTIIVEHKDRLVRFGFEYIEGLINSNGRKILVADKEEMKDDLVQDMIDVLTSFCARLYGRRSAKNKAKAALEAIQK